MSTPRILVTTGVEEMLNGLLLNHPPHKITGGIPGPHLEARFVTIRDLWLRSTHHGGRRIGEAPTPAFLRKESLGWMLRGVGGRATEATNLERYLMYPSWSQGTLPTSHNKVSTIYLNLQGRQ